MDNQFPTFSPSNASSCCFCGVSLSSDKLNNLSQLKCGHVYCKFCLANYLKASIASRKLPLTCILPECRKLIPIEELVVIFGVQMMEKFFEFARFNNTSASPSSPPRNIPTKVTDENGRNQVEGGGSPPTRKYRCPNAKCARVISRDELKLSNSTCPSCSQKIIRNSCSVCGEEGTCSKCVAARLSATKGAPVSAHPTVTFSPGTLAGNNTKSNTYPPRHTPQPESFSYFSSNVFSTLFGAKDNAPAPASSQRRNSTSNINYTAQIPANPLRASAPAFTQPENGDGNAGPSWGDFWNIWAPLPSHRSQFDNTFSAYSTKYPTYSQPNPYKAQFYPHMSHTPAFHFYAEPLPFHV